jgi:hypothetical protein
MGSTDMKILLRRFYGFRCLFGSCLYDKIRIISVARNDIGSTNYRVFGYLIDLPTLKTKGYYLSLVTMAIQIAFTQLINIIYLEDQMEFPE